VITRAFLHNFTASQPGPNYPDTNPFGNDYETRAVYGICMVMDLLTWFATTLGAHGWASVVHSAGRELDLLHQSVNANDLQPGAGSADAVPVHPVLELRSVPNVRAYLACRRLLLVRTHKLTQYASAATAPMLVATLIYVTATVVLISGVIPGVSVAVQVRPVLNEKRRDLMICVLVIFKIRFLHVVVYTGLRGRAQHRGGGLPQRHAPVGACVRRTRELVRPA
jgi:hypothetical protein